jgi:hypothetical protein
VPSRNSKSIPKLQLDNKKKRFDDENVVLALFQYSVMAHSKWRIQKGTHGEKVET